jgi:structural maintenance of chromosome 2
LISAIDNKHIRALEQSAGGRIFNIIVDTENTAKMLMKKECFSTHVYLIPNNKIQGQPINENVNII